ncbi:hypothetical protein NT6N_00950 [Oceaniferula spumae]|uniref:Heme A synthase n=1 Tax=Oceaniferula spumae TaxID=2979115 RepID=A0AAT9FGE3_9BACT
MGCPDWPTCWGCLVPPTSADQIDPAKLDIEKYRIKAAAHGIDPATITKESIIANYNPVHTWIEYINRLTSTPLAVLTLITFVMAFLKKNRIRSVMIAATLALILLGVNGWMGARIVHSGLKPGIITIHMALAIAMLLVLVFVAWRGCESPWKLAASSCRGGLSKLAWLLFILVLAEGVVGSQVREKTDELKRTHEAAPRSEWVGELEHSTTYLIHRSASWVILLVAILFFMKAIAARTGASMLEKVILGSVLGQMVLGIVLSQVGILPVAQVLHIGLSSILVSALFLWLLASSRMDLRPWNG